MRIRGNDGHEGTICCTAISRNVGVRVALTPTHVNRQFDEVP